MHNPHLPATDTAEPDPLVGRLLEGRFELVELLAHGGMGKVYRAIQRPIDRVCAVKVLHRAGSSNDARIRFFREASVAARLAHPNTVRLYDYGACEDGLCFIAMELLEGRTLADLIREEAPVAPGRALELVRQIGASMSEAHGHGIVHRDLKPANVFVVGRADDEHVKVLDFGLVKQIGEDGEITGARRAIGSPPYMAPEQARAEDVDARADIYAVGVILFELLTGRVPFLGATSAEILYAHTASPVPALAEVLPTTTASRTFEWVVRTCLEKGPDDRFATMQELLRALRVVRRELLGRLDGQVPLRLDRGQVVLPPELCVSVNRAVTPVPPVLTAMISPAGTLSTSSVTPAADLRSRSPFRRRSWVPMAAVAAAVTFALIAGWAIGQGTLAGVSPMASVGAWSKTVLVEVRSTPAGAEVLETDGRLLGHTPLEVELHAGEPRQIDLGAPGYRTRRVWLTGDRAQRVILLDPE
ncbi:MAG: serine/threonine protein kinase [Myxococcota bacterium]|jgi:serine/threonine protein kinase